MNMKSKNLLGACLLLASMAACTNNEILHQQGGGSEETVPGQGAVVFALEGLGTGSVENTRANTVLATQEENRIDSLDIYVFAYDNDGTFGEDISSTDLGIINSLTPASDDDVANNDKWYLQEKWTWKNPEPGRSSGNVDTSKPQLHEIAQLGGSGVARTAVIYPQKGRYLKFFIVANCGQLTASAGDSSWTPAFNTEGAAGTTAADFLNLRLRLGAAAEDTRQLPIICPLPMTAQMATTVAEAVDMTAAATGDKAQQTRRAVLTRAVTRFDILNLAGPATQGDYTLTDVLVSGHYNYTNMQNLIPAGGTRIATPTAISLEGREWTTTKDPATGHAATLLPSAFYTSPTLGGETEAEAMQLGLRGVLGKQSAEPGSVLTPLNFNVPVVDADKNPIELKANYRYVLKILRLSPDVHVTFSVIDWNSEILDADLSNSPMPKLIWENSQGITWNMTDADMHNHNVVMDNTAPGGRLAFELGTYTADELADLLADPENADKIPFEVKVVSLNDNPAYPEDNTWLKTPVISFDNVKRDRFNVVLDVRPEGEVPANVRPDLMVMVANKEHAEKQLFFRVKSEWKQTQP